jgi:hypothetical protein
MNPNFAGLLQNDDQVVKTIRSLLEHDYQAEDGRTILRELVQNADDANATRLALLLLNTGLSPWSEHALLTGPALVITNDGPFEQKHDTGLRLAAGGTKGRDQTAVGRFGLGLKSVFHWCEAFAYCGRGPSGEVFCKVVNPYDRLGVGDPVNKDWSLLGKNDQALLTALLDGVLGSTGPGLLLYLPLRSEAHCNRGSWRFGHSIDVANEHGKANLLGRNFNRLRALTLALAQCGWLAQAAARERETCSADESLRDVWRTAVEHYALDKETGPATHLGRYDTDGLLPEDRPFRAAITLRGMGSTETISTVGVERARWIGNMERLTTSDDWPKDHEESQTQPGFYSDVARKAVPHGAVTIVRRRRSSSTRSLTIRWATFFVLDDGDAGSEVDRARLVEFSPDGIEGWDDEIEILLHGYFFPSKDRKKIPGLAGDSSNETDRTVRIMSEWNRGVSDHLCLPLLPQALAASLPEWPESARKHVLDMVAKSQIIKDRMGIIRGEHWLVPIGQNGPSTWTAIPAAGMPTLRAVSNWGQAPTWLRSAWLMGAAKAHDGHELMLLDHGEASARFHGDIERWHVGELGAVLDQVLISVEAAPAGLRTMVEMVGSVLGAMGTDAKGASVRVLEWILGLVQRGLGPHGAAVTGSPDDKNSLDNAYRALAQQLKSHGVLALEVRPVTHSAIEHLAHRVDLPRLWLLPCSTQSSHGLTASEPDRHRQSLMAWLQAVGQTLQAVGAGDKFPGGERSWRILAQDLTDAIGLPHVRDARELQGLPLIPYWTAQTNGARLATPAEEKAQRDQRLVFDKVVNDEGEVTLDKGLKEILRKLDSAVAQTAWVIAQPPGRAGAAEDGLASGRRLAQAVLQNKSTLALEYGARKDLLESLLVGSDAAEQEQVRKAARLLAHGKVEHVEDERELVFVDPSDPTLQMAVAAWLRMRGDAWRLLDSAVGDIGANRLSPPCIKQWHPGNLREELAKWERAKLDASTLAETERIALLEIAATDDVLWRKLPLHPIQGIGLAALCSNTFRDDPNLLVPEVLLGKVRLLDPNRIGAIHHQKIEVFSKIGMVETALRTERPDQYFAFIADTLAGGAEPIAALPRDFRDVRDQLWTIPWLPVGTHGAATAPRDVLLAPLTVTELLAEMAPAPGDSAFALPVHFEPAVWQRIRGLVEHEAQALHNNYDWTSLICDYLEVLPAWKVSCCPLEASHWKWAETVPQLDGIRGWKLIRTIIQASGGPHEELRHSLRKHFSGGPSNEILAFALNTVAQAIEATPAPQNRQELEQLHRTLLQDATEAAGFWHDIVPFLRLPTRKPNSWKPSSQLLAASTGFVETLLVHDDWHKILAHHEKSRPRPAEDRQTASKAEDAAQILDVYLKAWKVADRLALGAFASLFGEPAMRAAGARTMAQVAQGFLGEIRTVKEVRERLDPNTARKIDANRVWIHAQAAGERTRSEGLCGQWLDVQPGHVLPAVFDSETWPSANSTTYGPYLEVRLRHVVQSDLSRSDAVKLLETAARQWATRVLGVSQGGFDAWWLNHSSDGQVDLLATELRILEYLPFTLRQLGVKEPNAIRDALHKLEVEENGRAEGQSTKDTKKAQGHDAQVKTLRGELARMVRTDSAIQKSVLAKVRSRLTDSGYGPASVLVELIQNADDALAERAAMENGRRDDADWRKQAGVKIVATRQGGDAWQVEVRHRGRRINFTGGEGFPAGKQRGWGSDLYKMLLLNHSGKPGADAKEGCTTTGQFGLGFKSVHLVSDSPQILSGMIRARIVGGLLPLAIKDSSDVSEDRSETVIRLDGVTTAHLDAMKAKLLPFLQIFPWVARSLTGLEVQVDGVTSRAELAALSPDLPEGWRFAASEGSVASGTLRFGLADLAGSTTHQTDRTSAIVLRIEGGLMVPFDLKTPTFWSLAPTEEIWKLGYVLSGGFKIDIGRTRILPKDAATTAWAERLGDEFGKGLARLADAVLAKREWAPAITAASAEAFLASLWTGLADGLDNEVEERLTLLRIIHANRRGLGWLASQKKVVPSGLDSPFSQLVGPVQPGSAVRVASEALASKPVQRLLETVPELLDAPGGIVVSRATAKTLNALLEVKTTDLRCLAMLDAWVGPPREIRVECAERLAALGSKGCWDAVDAESPRQVEKKSALREWADKLKFKSADGSLVLAGNLLLPTQAQGRSKDLEAKADTFDDELKRSAFAPASRVLHAEYARNTNGLDVFLRVRGVLKADAKDLAAWAVQAVGTQRLAVLEYLMRGELRAEVIETLKKMANRQWLGDKNLVRECMKQLPEAKQAWPLLDQLFARTTAQILFDLFGSGPNISGGDVALVSLPEPLSRAEAVERIGTIFALWADSEYRRSQLKDFSRELWPPTWSTSELCNENTIGPALQGESGEGLKREAWITLLILATVQGLGLQDKQHRGFIMKLHREPLAGKTWWEWLFGDGAPDSTWLGFFEAWTSNRDDAVEGKGSFSHWLKCLPELYAVPKWWDQYALILPQMGDRIPVSVSAIAPKSHADLMGTGLDAPALPAVARRFDWIVQELRRFGIIRPRPPLTEEERGLHDTNGYVPSEELALILHRLGMKGACDELGQPTFDGKAAFEFVRSLVGIEMARFFDLYDLPLRCEADLIFADAPGPTVSAHDTHRHVERTPV